MEVNKTFDAGHPYYNVTVGKKRHFRDFEKETLLKLVNRYLPIIDNSRADGPAKEQKLNAWKKITHQFNSSPNVTPALLKQLRRLWHNIKQRSKSGQPPLRAPIEIDSGTKPNLADIAANVIDAGDIQEPGFETAANRWPVMLNTEVTIERKRNFSVAEKNTFLQILQKYIPIINNPKRDTTSSVSKLNAWKKITKEFNTHPNTVEPALLKQLRCLWEKFKYRHKASIKAENDVNLTETTSNILGRDEEAHCRIMEESHATSGDCLRRQETGPSSVHITDEEVVFSLLYPEQYEHFMSKSVKPSPIRTNSLSNPEDSTQDPLDIPDNFSVSEESDEEDCKNQNESSPCGKDFAQLLLQEKIKLIKTYARNAKEESRRRMQILDEQLTQERIKTKMLLNNRM